MLTVHIDSQLGQLPYSVLAGWVMSAKKWEAFSDEWDKVLTNENVPRPFKMTEWANDKDGPVVGKLSRVIERHGPTLISCIVSTEEYNRQITDTGGDSFPYYLLFYGAISQVLQYYAGKTQAKIDFIFDEQNQEGRVFPAWEKFVKTATPVEAQLIGDRPSFKKDKCLMPLQAADMAAWWVRYARGARDAGQEVKYPWGESPAHIEQEWTPFELLRVATLMLNGDVNGCPQKPGY